MRKILWLFLFAIPAGAQSSSGSGFPPYACSANFAHQSYRDTTNNLSYTCANIAGTGYVWQLGDSPILPVVSAPSGSCTNGFPNEQVISTGSQCTCQSGTWSCSSGSGGSAAWSSLTNPTGNLALTQGSNLSSFANTNPFTAQSSFYSPWQFAGNSINFGTEWNKIYSSYMPNAYPSDEFDAGITVPNTSTVFQSNAIGGFVNCSQPSGNHYCVGLYGQGVVTATGSSVGGINGNVSDGGFASSNMIAGELNMQVANASTVGRGLYVQGNLGSNTQIDAIDTAAGTGAWRYGLNTGSPVIAPAYLPNVIYSVAGTALPTCDGGIYNGAELPVSDLATTTQGAIYAGSGDVSGRVACGRNSGALYSWYVTGAATYAGSAVQMTDTFTGTNGTDLSSHTADSGQSWIRMHQATWVGPLVLNGSNALTTTSLGAYFAAPSLSGADYTVTAPINVSTSGSGWGMVLGRTSAESSTTFSGYSCRLAEGTGTLLEKWVVGTNTQIGTTDTSATTGTHTIAIVMSGTTLTCKVDGSSSAQATGTDATFSAAGHVGLALNNGSGSGLAITQTFTVQ